MSFVMKEFIGNLTEEKQKILLFTMVTPYGKLIRTRLIKENSIYFPEKIFYEDVATTLLYHMYAKNIGLVSEPLYYYTVRTDSTVGKKNSIHHLDEAKAGLILYERFKERGFYRKYKNEIDMLFIIYFYMHPLAKAIEKFETPPLEYMEYLRDTMKQKYANYNENPYFKIVDDAHMYDYIAMNDESPKMLKELIMLGKYDKRNASYHDYYFKSKYTIEQLFNRCIEKKYRIGVWGAGNRGRDFLEVCDPQARFITAVFDNNEQLVRKKLETGHEVFKFSENYDKVEVVLCMNRYHYPAIYNDIQKISSSIIVLNFDLYVQFENNLVNNHNISFFNTIL
jgi:hypothetical protein